MTTPGAFERRVLSIVARIAELHGAPLLLGEGPGGVGLEATLRFPAV